MPNIYLRLPTFVCAYVRNRYTPHLTAEEPVRFPENYMEEALIMRQHLDIATNIHDYDDRVPACFSQTEWNNMLHGCTPQGKPVKHNRDKTLYLDYEEISEFCGMRVSKKTTNFDYLCIEIPKVVFFFDRYRKTNASWKLHKKGVSALQNIFDDQFKFAMLEFEKATRLYCLDPKGDGSEYIERREQDVWERFLYCYDIPITCESDIMAFRKLCQRLHDESTRTHNKRIREYVSYRDPRDKVIHIDK